jgi:hypothetical protein
MDCCSVWDKRKVPILAVVDVPHEEDPPITGKEQVLAARYYLRIYPPQRGQVGVVLPTRWDIPMAGVTAGVARVVLPPSVGYGINSSYRVEYVMWRPILNGVMVGKRARVRVPERVIKEEYWKVPHNHNKVMELQIVHLMERDEIPIGIMNPISVRSAPCTTDVVAMHCSSPHDEPLTWDIMERPLEGTYDKSLRDITMGVNLPMGREYIVEYLMPLTLRDVVQYKPDRTHIGDIGSCHDSSQCCPPLVAPWGRLPGTQGTSTRWYY